MDLEKFQNLPTDEVARLVREAGPKVCVFPINGTSRWFMLEHRPEAGNDFGKAYLSAIAKRYIEIFQLIFAHGVSTLLTPSFGPDLMEREVYNVSIAAEGLEWLATRSDFLDFYKAYGVRVRFYGDYRHAFDQTPYAHLPALFDEISRQTMANDQYRLFFGLFAHDATEAVAEIAVRFYREKGHLPDKRHIVEVYYGEHVETVDIFIGFDKFAAFDMPLVATGNEDLYFSIAPSPYITQTQLRAILYDHLYTRRETEPNYLSMATDEWNMMREFYHANRDAALGIGARQERGGYWYPLPQVNLPTNFMDRP
ncbi:MAG: hypothetical protein JW850_22955 [Thermoflexales bacterium]|nr:hypothetical protein [Thermoflexales bacterium]